MCYELFEPQFCMTSAIIFSAKIVQKRSGLNLAGIVVRDAVGVLYFWGLVDFTLKKSIKPELSFSPLLPE